MSFRDLFAASRDLFVNIKDLLVIFYPTNGININNHLLLLINSPPWGGSGGLLTSCLLSHLTCSLLTLSHLSSVRGENPQQGSNENIESAQLQKSLNSWIQKGYWHNQKNVKSAQNVFRHLQKKLQNFGISVERFFLRKTRTIGNKNKYGIRIIDDILRSEGTSAII